MKRFIVPLALVALIAVAYGSFVSAQVGPNTVTHAYATATQCAAATPVAGNQTTLLSASTSNPGSVGPVISNRLCYIVQNMSTTIPVEVGDSVSATQGIVLNAVPASQPTGSAGGSQTVCVTTALNACGIGGSAVVGATEITR